MNTWNVHNLQSYPAVWCGEEGMRRRCLMEDYDRATAFTCCCWNWCCSLARFSLWESCFFSRSLMLASCRLLQCQSYIVNIYFTSCNASHILSTFMLLPAMPVIHCQTLCCFLQCQSYIVKIYGASCNASHTLSKFMVLPAMPVIHCQHLCRFL